MDPVSRIASKIPGFSGYIERANRRNSDKILRDAIADRFVKLHQRISSLQRDLISEGEISYIDDLESAAIKIQTFADRVRNATRGYAGLFDAVKVREEELTLLYQYDEKLLGLVDEISNAIENVEASIGSDGLAASIRHLENLSQDCIDTFDRREEVIIGDIEG
jgi:hypothetical protein